MTDWRKRGVLNWVLVGVSALIVVCLVLLGNWQLRRLEWKTELIHAVETRAYGEAVPAPGRSDWPDVTAQSHAYLRVSAEGRLLGGKTVFVKALTELGAGFWMLQPLERPDGEIIWINRGFVPSEYRSSPERDDGTDREGVTVTGLLRITEPGGTLLEKNAPDENRWYSRDTEAFSRKTGLSDTAPYFIDADHTGAPEALPRGGLTIINFRNHHLQYALTWYTMALLLIGGVGYVVWLSRRPPTSDDE
ncbi:SURF1 family protein [Stappia sp. BW2]|jgi:surfeit locus 1 family protein|uniref:SURF1 family protein n=1 Tax=Stappia sp. BW2 TaxID=2592622 RepID=UPI0011DE7392|nr:SURF1 family protein [Stappia sp. BW2]TYC64119.1 SURF1 family protein [Stappia sp. BW2]